MLWQKPEMRSSFHELELLRLMLFCSCAWCRTGALVEPSRVSVVSGVDPSLTIKADRDPRPDMALSKRAAETVVNHRTFSAAMIFARSLVVRRRAEAEVMLPPDPKIVLTGGPDFNNVSPSGIGSTRSTRNITT
ncbi:hypothetical protein QA639_33115 [Bradyrhizobium pachyrhizi]|nr:hypothetical protein [Bradyrhizobium pachyrhizi]WFU54443.1 hypothetical protein QA639_33115 [Bradyrhizobium pachyrhizi]